MEQGRAVEAQKLLEEGLALGAARRGHGAYAEAKHHQRGLDLDGEVTQPRGLVLDDKHPIAVVLKGQGPFDQVALDIVHGSHRGEGG